MAAFEEAGHVIAWMAWTWETAIFFGFIALALVILTLLAIYRPETPRKGILRFPTTRGDRFFVSLLGSAFIFILWMRLGGGDALVPARDLHSVRASRCFVSRDCNCLAHCARGLNMGGKHKWI